VRILWTDVETVQGDVDGDGGDPRISRRVPGRGRVVKRLIVGVSGASGSVYAIAALKALRQVPDLEVHLVLSEQARQTIALETDSTAADLEALAGVVHRDGDLAASISSGSYETGGMLVIPCSIKTAASIAYGFNANLLARAADVCLKEKRRVVLVVRETPLHLGHLRTLTQLAELGAVILPPVPGMYARPKTVDDIIAHTVGKALDQFGIDAKLFTRWSGA
jgi:flavin prenyltransferase